MLLFFFFQAEDGIRDIGVTGVQTCALPICFSLTKDLTHWINDGMMAVFFLVVGLEIKREILVGELSSPRRAALPIAAALGGAVLPALLYPALNFGSAGAPRWGIPMAPHKALGLGVLDIGSAS